MNYIKLNRRTGILTISSVFLLLIAGGIVRSTGSGMGCPDWPKCYGAWSPPTCICELPSNYQEIYLLKRLEKAKRFASVLNMLGLHSQANQLLQDPNLSTPETFNTVKAWTEYINRIIGVLSGFFSLIFFISLLKIRKYVSGFKFYSGFFGFIMMLFNAWLGSIVVATNLFPVIITIHYLAAYAVLALFMLSIVNARVDEENQKLLGYKWYFLFFLIMSIVQVIFGTQLREVTDKALIQGVLLTDKKVNFEFLGVVFQRHWIMAVCLIIFSLIPAVMLRNKIKKKWIKLVLLIPLTMIIQYFTGVLNLKYGFPLISQVSHIFFAGIIFGITLYICISIFRASKKSLAFD